MHTPNEFWREIDDAPYELAAPIREFWPAEEWDAAASIAWLESSWRWDAVRDTRDSNHPCGSVVDSSAGVLIYAEFSIGYFQINACNYPDWNAAHFYNVRQNAGTAHQLWQERGWQPWYFSAIKLGLI